MLMIYNRIVDYQQCTVAGCAGAKAPFGRIDGSVPARAADEELGRYVSVGRSAVRRGCGSPRSARSPVAVLGAAMMLACSVPARRTVAGILRSACDLAPLHDRAIPPLRTALARPIVRIAATQHADAHA
jgi:hypothetical protein